MERVKMRALLDTNIIIHREGSRVIVHDIGTLFYWLDRLSYDKCIHPLSVAEIRKYQDQDVVAAFQAKLDSYHILRTEAPESPEITAIRSKYDRTDNDSIDTSLLKEVFSQRVDLLISEDRAIHTKAAELGIPHRVFTIDTFLEKVIAENPELVDYQVLSVQKEYFGNLDLSDPFFDTFKRDYDGFAQWFNRKADEIAYVCRAENNEMLAFLYVKREDTNEDYSDIEPRFRPCRRLKVGTFKVIANGFKLGERFLKIVFDNAMRFQVDEIYVTIFDHSEDQRRLINLLCDWGFQHHGVKQTKSGTEQVYTRDFRPAVHISDPRLTYPYFSQNTRKFIVPIYPEYHTELFPDSFLRTESPDDYVENRPNRNAISKVYISRSFERDLKSGDIIVFYRTKFRGPAYYTSVVTTLGVVQEVITSIPSLDEFILLCRKRSVFTDEELALYWNRNPSSRPFIVNFLYTLSFTLGHRLNFKTLKELGIISEAPRGFEPLSDAAFKLLLEKTDADPRYVVDQA
jgi:hypothetical protein